ncbi:MAG: HIT domain-containing protein [Pseudomonadota bacterium]
MNLQLPQTPDCFFCGILDSGANHWAMWAEDELTVTLLNGRQFEPGQSMIVPRRHAPTLLDLRHDELSAVLNAAQRASRVLLDVLSPSGLLLYQNNGVGSGQEVPHFHLHVVPRSPDSDWGFGPPHLAELERRTSDPRFDHTIHTEDKQAMALRLRESVT